MTKHHDVGGATESLQSTSQDLGNLTAQDVKPQTSKLLDELNSFLPKKKSNGMICSVHKVLEGLKIEEKTKLQELLDNELVLSSDISMLLKRNGFYISGDVMRRHRRRKVSGTGCCCP